MIVYFKSSMMMAYNHGNQSSMRMAYNHGNQDATGRGLGEFRKSNLTQHLTGFTLKILNLFHPVIIRLDGIIKVLKWKNII